MVHNPKLRLKFLFSRKQVIFIVVHMHVFFLHFANVERPFEDYSIIIIYLALISWELGVQRFLLEFYHSVCYFCISFIAISKTFLFPIMYLFSEGLPPFQIHVYQNIKMQPEKSELCTISASPYQISSYTMICPHVRGDR